MKLNKKGFTLVELLAVIVILAIILAIAVPRITGVLSSAKEAAFEADVKLIIKGIEYKMLELDATGGDPLTPGYMDSDDLIAYGANADNYELGETGDVCQITSLSPVTIRIFSKSTSEFGALSASGTRNDLTIPAEAE